MELSEKIKELERRVADLEDRTLVMSCVADAALRNANTAAKELGFNAVDPYDDPEVKKVIEKSIRPILDFHNKICLQILTGNGSSNSTNGLSESDNTQKGEERIHTISIDEMPPHTSPLFK